MEIRRSLQQCILLSFLVIGIAACGDTTRPLDVGGPSLAATASGNPFVGSWEGIDTEDNSHLHLTIGDGPRMPTVLLDDGGSVCLRAGLGFVSITFSGFGVVTGDDPPTFEFTGDVYCHPRGPRGRQLVAEDVTLQLVYIPETDTLAWEEWGICLHRSARPESCG